MLMSIISAFRIHYPKIQIVCLSMYFECLEKEFTKNEHLYSQVIASLRCNRIRYAINTLEAILMSDPTDVLAIHVLSHLYPMIGDSQGMVFLLVVSIM